MSDHDKERERETLIKKKLRELHHSMVRRHEGDLDEKNIAKRAYVRNSCNLFDHQSKAASSLLVSSLHSHLILKHTF